MLQEIEARGDAFSWIARKSTPVTVTEHPWSSVEFELNL